MKYTKSVLSLPILLLSFISLAQAATGSLTVKVSPTEAQIRIMNIEAKYEDGIELDSSQSYDILATHPGFDSSREMVEIDEGRNVVEINLIRSKTRKGKLNQPAPLCETRKRALTATFILIENPHLAEDVDGLNAMLLDLDPVCFYADKALDVVIYKTSTDTVNGIELHYAEVSVHKENGDNYYPDSKRWWVTGPKMEGNGIIQFDDGSHW